MTGLSRAGKTVFISSLVHNLLNGGRLPLFELTDRVTVFLQFLGRGAHQICRLLVGQRAIHGVLAQLLGGALEVFDGLSISRLLVFQRGVLGEGRPAFVPGIARPEPDHQRQHGQQEREAPAEHQHTALPGQPAAIYAGSSTSRIRRG